MDREEQHVRELPNISTEHRMWGSPRGPRYFEVNRPFRSSPHFTGVTTHLGLLRGKCSLWPPQSGSVWGRCGARWLRRRGAAGRCSSSPLEIHRQCDIIIPPLTAAATRPKTRQELTCNRVPASVTEWLLRSEGGGEFTFTAVHRNCHLHARTHDSVLVFLLIHFNLYFPVCLHVFSPLHE